MEGLAIGMNEKLTARQFTRSISLVASHDSDHLYVPTSCADISSLVGNDALYVVGSEND